MVYDTIVRMNPHCAMRAFTFQPVLRNIEASILYLAAYTNDSWNRSVGSYAQGKILFSRLMLVFGDSLHSSSLVADNIKATGRNAEMLVRILV